MGDRVVSLLDWDESAVAGELRAWRGKRPAAGVLALVPESERERIPELQKAAMEAGVPLVGAVFPQLVTEGGFQSRGLQLVRLDSMPPYLLQPGLAVTGEKLEGVVDELGQALLQKLGSAEAEPTLFMIFDAMVPLISTIMEGLYLRLADRVRYLGVNAGSESFSPIPCLFDRERIIQGGVLALLLSDAPRAVLAHGYRPPAQMVAATSTEGNRIISIDWRPAFEVYREQVKKHYGEEINSENFYRLAVHFPFGIMRVDQEVLVRIPVALEEDGSLFCVGEVPANSVLTLLEAPSPDSLDTARTLAQGLGATEGKELLLFYCAGRRIHLGDAAGQEVRTLRQLTGAARLYGALSLGEIGSARHSGYPLFHNATLVCMPV